MRGFLVVVGAVGAAVAVGIPQGFPGRGLGRADSAGSTALGPVASRGELVSGPRGDELRLGKGTPTPRIDRSRSCDINEEWLVCHTVSEFHNRRQEACDQPPDPILRPHAPE